MSRTLRLVTAVVPLVILTAAGPGHAQGDPAAAPTPIALGQVLQVSVRNNPTLELATIDVEIADAQVVAAAGLDDWLLNVNGSASQLRIYNVTFGDFVTSKNVDGTVGVSRSLPFGGTVGLTVDSSYSSNPYTLRQDYTDSLSLSYSQPLWQGFGSRVARASQHQAALGRDAAVLGRRAQALVVVREVITAYWELAYAIRNVEIQKSSVALAQEQLRITRAGIDAGSVAPTEALAVEQVIASREQQIIAAELAVTQRSLALRRLAGMEIGPNAVDLSIVAPLTVAPQPLELAELLERTYQTSPDLARLESLQKNAQIGVELATDATDPRLDLSLAAGPIGVGTKFTKAATDMAKFDSYQVSASVAYQQSLENRSAEGSLRQARADLHQARVNEVDLRAQLAATLVQAVQTARAAEKRMEISERAIGLAEQNIDAEKARFDLGRATNFDIAQRQDELKQAQLGYVAAAKDYLEAVAQIDALTGDLLGKYGITLEAE